jgi:hypothetical protein
MSKRLLLVLFLVLSASVIAHATTDPRIVITEPGCQEGDTSVTSVTDGFVFASVSGGGVFNFCNNTGVNWTNILVGVLSTAPLSTIDCPSATQQDPANTAHLAFSTCLLFASPNPHTSFYAYFFGTSPGVPALGFNGFPGVPNGERFVVNLNCPEFISDCTPWPDGSRFVGIPNFDFSNPLPSVPEPSTLAMLATAFGAGLLRRKRTA